MSTVEEHALMSPSRLQRIIDCPGSFRFTQKFEKKSSSYADKGTMLHDRMKMALIHLHGKPVKPEDLPEEIKFADLEVDENWALNYCLDFLRQAIVNLCEDADDLVYMFIETRTSLLPFDPVFEHVAGTADIVLHTKRIVHAIDWKFGQGVFVSAEANDQLLSYAVGSIDSVESLRLLTELRMSICQPFLDNIGTEVWSPLQCEIWLYDRVAPGILAAMHEEAAFVPGEKQCRFCDGKMVCEARTDRKHEIAQSIFSGQLVPYNEVPISMLGDMLKKAKELKYYIGELEKYARSVILQGGEFPGYKMVEGRSIRTWGVPEIQVMETLESHGVSPDLLFESKLVSPAKAEKLKRGLKPVVAELVVKKSPTLSLVPDDDPRPAFVASSAEDVFALLADDSDWE